MGLEHPDAVIGVLDRITQLTWVVCPYSPDFPAEVCGVAGAQTPADPPPGGQGWGGGAEPLHSGLRKDHWDDLADRGEVRLLSRHPSFRFTVSQNLSERSLEVSLLVVGLDCLLSWLGKILCEELFCRQGTEIRVGWGPSGVF